MSEKKLKVGDIIVLSTQADMYFKKMRVYKEKADEFFNKFFWNKRRVSFCIDRAVENENYFWLELRKQKKFDEVRTIKRVNFKEYEVIVLK